jgi:hypothetical protein
VVGHLHSHPCEGGESDNDRESWKKFARDFGHPLAGLIVSGRSRAFPFVDATLEAWASDGCSIEPIPLSREDMEVYF